MNGVEIHFHALPGLDDGPATLEEAVELTRLAAIDGTATVTATPHVRGDCVTDVSDFGERIGELQAAVDAARLGVTLRAGAELGRDMVARLRQAELESVAQGPAGARWVLLEAPFDSVEEDFHLAAEELRERRFGVVIAHPERSADAILDGATGLRRELERGAVAQVNAQSITGDHGIEAQRAALGLIREGLVGAVSSDAHGPTRPPLLGEARVRLLEAGMARALCDGVIRDVPLWLMRRGLGARRPFRRRARLTLVA